MRKFVGLSFIKKNIFYDHEIVILFWTALGARTLSLS